MTAERLECAGDDPHRPRIESLFHSVSCPTSIVPADCVQMSPPSNNSSSLGVAPMGDEGQDLTRQHFLLCSHQNRTRKFLLGLAQWMSNSRFQGLQNNRLSVAQSFCLRVCKATHTHTHYPSVQRDPEGHTTKTDMRSFTGPFVQPDEKLMVLMID
jgi:hypothetical protein